MNAGASSLGFERLHEPEYLGRHRTVDDRERTTGPAEPVNLVSEAVVDMSIRQLDLG
jgi:hypothetical protein